MKVLYIAAAVIALGSCSGGGEPNVVLPTPADVRAAAQGTQTILLTWSYSGTAIDVFRIERRLTRGPGSFEEIVSVDGDARTYVDENLQAATPYVYRIRACDGRRCSLWSAVAGASTDDPARAQDDRPDDITGAQIRIMYVLPSDGVDRAFDTDGSLARSVASFHTWFQQKSGGYTLRFDRHDGALDVGFFRLAATNAQVAQSGAFVVTEIERMLRDAGKIAPGKIYIVYYDGSSTYACGGAAWPPNVPGQVAAMYLKGAPPGGSCGSTFVPTPTSPPEYWEFAALHDLLHTFGIVSTEAPNHTDQYPAHVPEPLDLMYTGTAPWGIGPNMTIDVGDDDYFGANVAASLPALERTPYVAAPVAAAVAPLSLLGPMTAGHAATLREKFARLPMHPPYPRNFDR
jgi:Fibronectin type III domain